ncbi:MAG: ATP-binding protein [Nevskia sp.]|nr:ATP-binding protein [Nevskia sp.]
MAASEVMQGQQPAAVPRRRASLQARLLLAFLIVGLVPMFFAAELASQVVTRAFEGNLKTWLNETSIYFLSSIADTQQEAADIARVLALQPELLQRLIDKKDEMPALVRDLVASEGFRVLAIIDDRGGFVYSSTPMKSSERIRLGSAITLYRVMTDKGAAIMVASVVPFQSSGRQYQLLLGSWLDDDFFGRLGYLTSFDFRLYGATADGFVELYRSQGVADSGPRLEPRIAAELRKPDAEVFDRQAVGGAFTGIYRPLRSDVGELQGVVFCGLRTRDWATAWVSRGNVFIIIFLTGTALSLLVGYAVSRRLARPLRSLASGVQAITAGDYHNRVEVEGNDEVAELAQAFNGMSQRLEQLHELETELRRRDRLSALGQVAAGIAHEVRNPLGIIRTSAELIRKRQRVGDADQQLLQNVIDEVRRIDQLISDFLAFVKPVAVMLLPLRSSDVIARVTRFCEPELAVRGIALEVRDEAPDAWIDGDADALHQAALNVVLNAIDAMSGGGKLLIGQRVLGKFLHLRFTDSGPGLPEAVRQHVFDPFFTTKPQGTGLGLAKVVSVMEGHHGSVECHNEAGGGATFEFILPLSRKNTAS